MEPVWRLLKSKSEKDDWNRHYRGGLRSAIANRQFPQARMLACGFATHGKCLMCLNKIVDDERLQGSDAEEADRLKRTAKDTVEATDD